MSNISQIIEKLAPLFFWLPFLYPRAKGIPISHQLYYLFHQKILRKHGSIPWPVHRQSRILYWKNITNGNRCAPGINAFCYIQARNGIILGNNVRIGPGVGLISASHDLDDYDQHQKCAPIKIGNNVWIGMNSVILQGVTIGDNVAIGAGSIVTHDIEPNSIAVGNPCKVIKKKSPYKGNGYDEVQTTL